LCRDAEEVEVKEFGEGAKERGSFSFIDKCCGVYYLQDPRVRKVGLFDCVGTAMIM
jgi:hypothetical protein